MADLRITEPLQDGIDVGQQVEPARRAQCRSDVFPHHRKDQGAQLLVAHRIRDSLMASEQPEVRKRGVGTVQKTQLGPVVSRNVIRQGNARRRPIRSTGLLCTGLQHPLHVTFALNRPTILQQKNVVDALTEGFSGRGSDAIHHRAGEAHFVLDPAREAGVAKLRELTHGASQPRSVIDEVVATDDGQRLDTGNSPTLQTLYQVANQAARNLGRAQIALDVRVTNVEVARAIQAIPLLGNRNRHDPSRRSAQAFEHPYRVLRRDEDFAQGANDLVGNRLVERGEGVQAVLGLQCVADFGAPERHATNTPPGVVRQQLVHKPSLMHPMESTGPEMHDAGVERRTVIAWTQHLRANPGQGRLR